jgi:hypothetical protein
LPNQPIAGAQVQIVGGPNSGRTAISDSSGSYVLAALTIGNGTVRVSQTGYVTSERPIEIGAVDRPNEDFAITRTTFKFSGRVMDALGSQRFNGDALYLPRVTATSTLTGTVVGTPSGNSYSFASLPWGTYQLTAAEQNGSTNCFSAASTTLTVSAEDIERGLTLHTRDFSLERRRGIILVSARERRPEGGHRMLSGLRVEIDWAATVASNVGKSGTSDNRATWGDYNLMISDVFCDEVHIRVFYEGRGTSDFDSRLTMSDNILYGTLGPAKELIIYR